MRVFTHRAGGGGRPDEQIPSSPSGPGRGAHFGDPALPLRSSNRRAVRSSELQSEFGSVDEHKYSGGFQKKTGIGGWGGVERGVFILYCPPPPPYPPLLERSQPNALPPLLSRAGHLYVLTAPALRVHLSPSTFRGERSNPPLPPARPPACTHELLQPNKSAPVKSGPPQISCLRFE